MIDAKTWREMTVDEILDSVDIATRVLRDKGFDAPDQILKTLEIIKDLADILIETAKYEG